MPTPTDGDDVELDRDDEDEDDGAPGRPGRRPSWWRRLVAGGARAAARGIRAVQRGRENRRQRAVDRAQARRARRRG